MYNKLQIKLIQFWLNGILVSVRTTFCLFINNYRISRPKCHWIFSTQSPLCLFIIFIYTHSSSCFYLFLHWPVAEVLALQVVNLYKSFSFLFSSKKISQLNARHNFLQQHWLIASEKQRIHKYIYIHMYLHIKQESLWKNCFEIKTCATNEVWQNISKQDLLKWEHFMLQLSKSFGQRSLVLMQYEVDTAIFYLENKLFSFQQTWLARLAYLHTWIQVKLVKSRKVS